MCRGAVAEGEAGSLERQGTQERLSEQDFSCSDGIVVVVVLIYLFIYLIFGRVGSLLLRVGFL